MAPYHTIVKGRRGLRFGGALIAFGLAGAAHAQTMGANSASYNAGYGRTAGSENQPVNASMRDANGNLVVAGGQLLSPSNSSVFSTTNTSGGVGAASTGVGSNATAVGNSLTVVTTGNYNTVIVNSHQTNTGAITATSSVSGGVGNAQ